MAHQRATAMLAALGVIASIFPAGATLFPESAGVCYGVHGASLPSAAEVVQLYKSNGILNMRIYQPDVPTLLALKGSKIKLLMGVADEDVPRLAASASAAADWVKLNIQPYLPGVLFQYIAVSNEITGSATQNIAPAMKNLNAVLSAAGLDDIQVSTAVRMDVLSSSSPPSSGTFKDGYIKDVLAVLNSTYATGLTVPLLVNVYPYFAYTGDTKNIDLNFALFQPSSTVIRDNGLNYTNLFDAMVDAVYAALKRENLVVPVVVSESGWPSEGGVGASVTNARTYNQNLVNHIRNGTPKRPYWLETIMLDLREFLTERKLRADMEARFLWTLAPKYTPRNHLPDLIAIETAQFTEIHIPFPLRLWVEQIGDGERQGPLLWHTEESSLWWPDTDDIELLEGDKAISSSSSANGAVNSPSPEAERAARDH